MLGAYSLQLIQVPDFYRIAIFVTALGLLLFRGLLRPEVRTYLNEQ